RHLTGEQEPPRACVSVSPNHPRRLSRRSGGPRRSHHHVVLRARQVLENPLLLGEIDGDEPERLEVERIRSELGPETDLLEAFSIERAKAQAERIRISRCH